MKHVFYFLTIAPILWEMIFLVDVKKTHHFLTIMKAKKGKELTSKEKQFSLWMFGYIVWIIIGFFTFQWVVFLGLFIFSFIPKNNIWLKWIDSLISIVVLVFIIINSYHLKIDVFQWLRGFLA